MSEYPVGHATRYPTIGGIPICVHLGGQSADGKTMEAPVTFSEDRPEIHMNAFTVCELGDLIVWKDYPKEPQT
jgi:hypothetical protein